MFERVRSKNEILKITRAFNRNNQSIIVVVFVFVRNMLLKTAFIAS